EPRRELPAEINNVVESAVEAVAAIGGMTVRRIAGDEDAADLIVFRNRDAQVPEAHIIEFAREVETRSLLQQSVEIVIVAGRIGGHWRMEEKSFANVDAAEEPPISFQRGMHGAKRRARREALQPLV